MITCPNASILFSSQTATVSEGRGDSRMSFAHAASTSALKNSTLSLLYLLGLPRSIWKLKSLMFNEWSITAYTKLLFPSWKLCQHAVSKWRSPFVLIGVDKRMVTSRPPLMANLHSAGSRYGTLFWTILKYIVFCPANSLTSGPHVLRELITTILASIFFVSELEGFVKRTSTICVEDSIYSCCQKKNCTSSTSQTMIPLYCQP